MTYEYYVSGTLPEGTSTYVERKADDELLAELKAGQYCYVFDASKAGKSSIQIRVKSNLEKVGFACCIIDLQGRSTESEHSEKLYDGILIELVKNLKLEVNLSSWIKENHWLSPLDRFTHFIESVMLAQIPETIVIFFDEVNHLTNFKFSNDDFFGFIRFCYNQRANNPNYNRLVFCLSGIASPSKLVKNNQNTPFNISKAIFLEPFKLADVEPLQRGLKDKFDKPEAVMEEILYWTGGQPFLTQKLCKLMVENSEKDRPLCVEEVVREKIIKKWRNQDNPALLQTIENRIVKSQKASYLLELYQQIFKKEIDINDSSEVTELLLSGIVVKVDGKLRVFNRIYQEIFNRKWIENQLKDLRPYSENYHAWLDSGKTDKSRLLRGNALQEALEWKNGKNLSYEEIEYLDASREQERQEEQAAKDREAELERERKSKEAAEENNQILAAANQTLIEANKKANQKVRTGSIVLTITLLSAGILGIVSASLVKQIAAKKNFLDTVQELTQLAAQAQDEGSYPEAEELFSQAGQSVNIDDQNLKMDMVYTGISSGNLKIKNQNLDKAQKYLDKVKINLKDNSPEELQIHVLSLKTQGDLFEAQKNPEAIKTYIEAFQIWDSQRENISPFQNNLKNKILSSKNVEALHQKLISLIEQSNNKSLEIIGEKVEKSLIEHYYAELENLLVKRNLKVAEEKTLSLLLELTDRKKPLDFLDPKSIKSLSCADVRRIDSLWVKHSDGNFGYSVQAKIFLETGNKLNRGNESDYNESAYQSFGTRIGWYDPKRYGGFWLNRREGQLNYSIKANIGHLPGNAVYWLWSRSPGLREGWEFSAHTAACTLPKD